jgi:polysaccharide biosynthesis/export protein VpsN
MFEYKNIGIFLFLLIMLNTHASADENVYKIGTGDQIQITVYGESDLSINTIVSDTGIINYPFLGELSVKGLTISQLEKSIFTGLKGDYLINPIINISIVQYRPFFIGGEVNSPGGYPYQPGLTVEKAAAIAQGFTDRASESKIYVVREGQADQKKIKAQLTTKIQLGDIVTVEQRFF